MKLVATDADIAVGFTSFDVGFDFHVFPFLEDSKLIVRPRLALASTASVYFALEPMTISPLLAPAFTFVLIFTIANFLSLKI